MSDDLIGQHVGNYVVKRLLGRGGMGEVYEAEHPEIGRFVAVKVLSRDLLTTSQLAERFLVEARAVARIRHPNIVEVYDFGRLADGRLYFMMEVLEGRELRGVMQQRGAMDAAEVLPYLEQICAGLQAAHYSGVVHRDLKPENIFVTKQQPLAIKLLDFGIAKLLENQPGGGLTSSGIMMGTPQFMAPEQAAGQPDRISPRTDIYALGVILYLMLAGRLPFVAELAPLLLAKHIQEAPPPIRTIAPSVPPPVAEVVHRCLEKDPMQRFASAAELFAAYSTAVAASVDEGLKTSAPSTQQVTVPIVAGPTLPPADQRPTALEAVAVSPREAVVADSAPQLDVRPITTFTHAASEVVTLPRRPLGKWVVAASGLCAVLLVGALLFRGNKTSSGSTPDAGAKVHTGARSSPDTQPGRTASATQPTTYSMAVHVTDARATCLVRVDRVEQQLRPPCLFTVVSGQAVRLVVARRGVRPFVEEWTATSNREIKLDVLGKTITLAKPGMPSRAETITLAKPGALGRAEKPPAVAGGIRRPTPPVVTKPDADVAKEPVRPVETKTAPPPPVKKLSPQAKKKLGIDVVD